MTVTVAVLRDRLEMFESRFRDLESQSQNNGGMLRRHEAWRKDYAADPYLIGAPDERVAARFIEITLNEAELNNDSKISLIHPHHKNEFMAKYTHLLEEYGMRHGGPPGSVLARAHAPIARYFENGGPIAARIFAGYTPPSRPYAVKYGRREFLEPMWSTGRVRISPASFYNNLGHNDAIRDNELHRYFYIPTYRERYRGVHSLNINGHMFNFGDYDICIPIIAQDYYLFSLCSGIHYRMPTDFEADSAIIIRDPALFVRRLVSAFRARRRDWRSLWGEVKYYDPYRDYKSINVHEMSKHFGYAYQREIRVVLRTRTREHLALEPEFLEVGPMSEYADFIHA